MKFSNFKGHLKTVLTHKKWVFYYCHKCGITWQGIKHDLSKFSWIEFSESVKYYQGGKRSPIDAAKEELGVSKAWQHHKGRNPHHYEYWTDRYDNGTVPIKMPFKYAVEMLCDYLGAGRAYSKKNFTYQSELAWWNNKKKIAFMHPATKTFISECLELFAAQEKNGHKFSIDMNTLHTLYEKSEESKS